MDVLEDSGVDLEGTEDGTEGWLRTDLKSFGTLSTESFEALNVPHEALDDIT